MPKVNNEVLGKPTPPEVHNAIQVIANYLRRGGWVECVISDSGGAGFHLTRRTEDFLKAISSLSAQQCVEPTAGTSRQKSRPKTKAPSAKAGKSPRRSTR